MKKLQLLLLGMISCFVAIAQSDPDNIEDLFSTHNDGDIKLYDGFNVQSYNYYYSSDTMYYQFYGKEMALPLKTVDFTKSIIGEEEKWTTTDRKKLYYLKLHPFNGKTFPSAYDFKFTTIKTEANMEITMYFTSNQMAQNALAFMKAPHDFKSEIKADDAEFDDAIDKILAEDKKVEDKLSGMLAHKDDIDFECKLSGRSPKGFKYNISRDTLWFFGTELYTIVIPVASIDFTKTISYESGIWLNKDGSKAIEISLQAEAGKSFAQDFASQYGVNSVMEQKLGGKKITTAGLVIPDIQLAEKLVQYLNDKK